MIRRGRLGFEIEDVSRYGLLVDGVWPGKHTPVPLRPGMRIELTASIKGIVSLEVTAVLAHALVLHRVDAGAQAECFYLMAPEMEPTAGPAGASSAESLPRAGALPLLFHRDGGFWHLDRANGGETPLLPGVPLTGLCEPEQRVRFTAEAYPEARVSRRSPGDRRGHVTASLHHA